MMKKTKIIVLAGSARKESVNKKLARVATKLLFEAGADVEYIDLKDYPMPIYDGDLESECGLPDNAKKIKQKFKEANALVVVSPEYNSSISPLLKNVFDWISRTETENEPTLVAFRGKVAALLSASPGALGGLRGLNHVRDILGNIGVILLPDQLAIGESFKAFDTQGNLVSDKNHDRVKKIMRQLVEVTDSLN